MKQEYLSHLRELGYRITPQREIILDVLCQTQGHATANEIYERVRRQSPAINLATVYRTLNFFCDIQLVASSEMLGQTVFEIVAATPHHHLVCRRCTRTEVLADHHFEELAEHLLAEHGFQPDIKHLTLSGICRDCQEVGPDG